MDALCLLRTLDSLYKLALWGVVSSFWLLPLYATAPTSEATALISDGVVKLTVAHVPEASERLIATVVSAYLLLGAAMYSILQEFRWFTAKRVQFLARRNARNYTIYVSGIPTKYRSDEALAGYFRRILSPEAVLEAFVALSVPKLEQLVESRRVVLEKLEHAYNVQQLQGVTTPTHRIKKKGSRGGGETTTLDSIDTYTRQLEEMNQQVSEAISRLEELAPPDASLVKRELHRSLGSHYLLSPKGKRPSRIQRRCFTEGDTQRGDDKSSSSNHSRGSNLVRKVGTAGQQFTQTVGAVGQRISHSAGQKISTAGQKISTAGQKISSATQETLTKTVQLVGVLNNTQEDGEALSAGFVTFTKLSSAAASLQMVHTNTPFEMVVTEAPAVEGIFWNNVGNTHDTIQVGRYMSFGFSTALCLFWTIPVSFILSLAEVESLKQQFDFLEDWIDKFPGLEALLRQLAPILLWVLGEILFVILNIIIKWEGHVGVSIMEASLFQKLSAFQVRRS